MPARFTTTTTSQICYLASEPIIQLILPFGDSDRSGTDKKRWIRLQSLLRKALGIFWMKAKSTLLQDLAIPGIEQERIAD